MPEPEMIQPQIAEAGRPDVGASSEAWSELVRALRAYGDRAHIDGETAVRNAANCVSGLQHVGSISGAEEDCRMAVHELHHRVKNELQVIVSLMSRNIRMAESHNEKVAWSTCISQIASVASLHDLMVPGGLSGRVDIGALLGTICHGFSKAFGLADLIEGSFDRVDASTAAAEALALILNEALTNAVKHGVPERVGNPVRVAMKVRRDVQAATLTITNSKVAGPVSAGHFGTRLIDMLAEKLGGHVSRMISDDTYTVECTFPLD